MRYVRAAARIYTMLYKQDEDNENPKMYNRRFACHGEGNKREV